MQMNTWLFFIFNCLIALWIIAHPLFMGGKKATASKRIILVFIGVVYGVIVLTAITQVEETGSKVSPYSGSIDTDSMKG